jgi:hypothetical protein
MRSKINETFHKLIPSSKPSYKAVKFGIISWFWYKIKEWVVRVDTLANFNRETRLGHPTIHDGRVKRFKIDKLTSVNLQDESWRD